MKKTLKVLIVFVSLTVPAAAQQDLVDPKTGEYTPHGVVASMIAGAQVTEMRCGMKGQITVCSRKSEPSWRAVRSQSKGGFFGRIVLSDATSNAHRR